MPYTLSFEDYVKALKGAGIDMEDPVLKELLKVFEPFCNGEGDKNPTISDAEREFILTPAGSEKYFFNGILKNGKSVKNCTLKFTLTPSLVELHDNRTLYMHSPWSWTVGIPGIMSTGVKGYSLDEAINAAFAEVKKRD